MSHMTPKKGFILSILSFRFGIIIEMNSNAVPPGTPHHLLTPKWLPGGPKWPTVSGKRSIPGLLELLQNKFVNSIIPFMRATKIQNGHQGFPKWQTGY